MMREADQDNKYMSKGSNLKPRSNQDKSGRRTCVAARKIDRRSVLGPVSDMAFFPSFVHSCLG